MQEQILNNYASFLLQDINEAVTISKIIEPILREAGYNTMNINCIEEELKVGSSSKFIKIDRCLKNESKPIAFLQCKQLLSSHRFKDDYEKTFNAALLKKIPYVIFTDGEIWKFYKLDNGNCTVFKKINLRFNPKLELVNVVNTLEIMRKEANE